MMMNCFCGMVDRRKTFSLISSRDHCQRSSPSRISDTPRAGFEPAWSSGLVQWSYAVVITTTPRRHKFVTNLSIFPFCICDKFFTHVPSNLVWKAWFKKSASGSLIIFANVWGPNFQLLKSLMWSGSRSTRMLC